MQEKSLIKKNILQYLDLNGITKYRFYQDTGITRGVLDQNNGMSEENTAKFLSYYKEVSAEWLLTGKGDIYRGNTNMSSSIVCEYNTRTDDNRRVDTVPLYSNEAFCGIVAMFDDINNYTPIDYITIPNLPAADGAVHICGDSMYPILKSGDIVIYKTLNDKTNILWGEMYLLSFILDGDSYTTVKYIQKSEEKEMVRLVSQNQHHQPKDIPFDSIRFAALVKASVRINSLE